ncbi:N-acetylmuramic acid 6-phosphate etherase [Biformimicrobium ophioploci]|uniref:N-acetylmuramic acid 6-phosphate etherase n=1 Tax=Biformimicrobium ophioploci TaxID=3036711 RepID=A0ABQ6M0N6_9GAMM|nr:N-acetylmuramic acid 6-phosphate etherase [Microbulbifer sp. NKW57]GMG87913.1 N-acetylmuramic acid 6-phosphate etherase [Microbulbifer sp. NKW57]
MSHKKLIESLSGLVSESRNPETMDIDLLPAEEILKRINAEDHKVPAAVGKILPSIATVVEKVVDAFRQDGRLIYIGAGTSGRLGVLDAVECRPTYSVPDSMVVPVMAGGESAMFHAVEGAEDDPDQGVADLKKIGLNARDVLVGISASGRTPYVVGALHYANELGCETVSLTCNPGSEITKIAKHELTPVVGPEALTGSTRMKSGTAQKLVLNMLTTASMILLGKSYHNLMVDLNASNEKLRARARRIVIEATGCSLEVADRALVDAGESSKLAIMMILTNLPAEEAEQLLNKEQGFLRRAVQSRAGS